MADKRETSKYKTYKDEELNENVLKDMKRLAAKGYNILLTSAAGGNYKVKKYKVETL